MAAEPELKPVADEKPAKKKGKSKLPLMLIVLVVLGGGGGGAWWWMNRGAAEAAPAEIPLSERGLITFEPFMANLADEGGSRFLKANIQLVVEDAAKALHASETPTVMSRVRSDILELLTEQQAPDLVTPEGKQKLKAAIKERAAHALEHTEVIDVLFSEFVVQF
jgi:flagellar protein FliL